MQRLEQLLDERQVVKYESFTTAAGKEADTKVELDCLDRRSNRFDQDVFSLAVAGLQRLAEPLEPDFLVSAPEGANSLTAALSYELDLPYVIPTKSRATKDIFEPSSKIIKKILETKRRGIIIDDVLTEGSTMNRIERLPMFRGRILAGLVVWDRLPDQERSLNFKTQALIIKHIPLKRAEVTAEAKTQSVGLN